LLGSAEQKSRAQKITEARPPQAADLPAEASAQAGLTTLKFGSNFFVNLDQIKT